jgi:putative PEP-CTERM system TPR-repeat lipoprotein
MIHRRLRTLLLGCCLVLGAPGCDMFASADAHVAKADKLIAANDRRGAMIELKNVLQDDPAHVGARVRLASLELHLGDPVSAEKDLRRAIGEGAPAETTAELAAQISLALGQARDLLARIDSGELHLTGSAQAFYRGQAMMAVRQHESARADFESIAAGDPRWPSARIGIAESLADQGKSEAAIAVLDELLSGHAKATEAWLARGAIRATRGEFAAAEQDLQRARSLAGPELPVLSRMKLLGSLAEVQLARSDLKGAANTQADIQRLAPDAVLSRVLAARIAMAKLDYTSAVASLQRVIATAPGLVPARFLLGAALLAQGNLGQAEQNLAQVVRSAPENVEARKLLAQAQLRLGRPDSAMQVIADAERPDDPQLELLLGLAQLQQGQATEGIAHLERAVAARPDDVDARLDLATAYLKTSRPGEAIGILTKTGPGSAPARRSGLLVAALLETNDSRRAGLEVERLLAAQPRNADALRLAASFHTQQREFPKARGFAQRMADLAPASAEAAFVRARIEVEAGDVAAAQQWLEKTLTLDPAHGPAHLALAGLAQKRGDLQAATRTLEDLRKRDANAVEARLRLAELYMRARNAAGAEPVIAELSALGKDRPDVLNALGTLYFDNRRYDEALSSFQAAASQDATQPIYWLNTARAQITLGASEPARVALEKAIAAQPGWLPAVGTLTMLDVKDGRGAAALARIAALKTQRPRDAAVLALEGDVQIELRNYSSAAAAYDAASALRPMSAFAVKAYRARQLGRLSEPARPLETWIASHPDDLQVRLVLGDAYQRYGDRKHAAQQYEAVASAGNAPPVMLNNLAWIYYELKDPRAEALAHQAYQGAPEIAGVADTYGWILTEGGKAAQAIPLLKRAAEGSDDPSVAYHYGVALLRGGSANEGRDVLGALLKRAPDFEHAGEVRKILSAPAAG